MNSNDKKELKNWNEYKEWEIINSNLDRIKVPGGWLYRTFDCIQNTKVLAITFVPFSHSVTVKNSL